MNRNPAQIIAAKRDGGRLADAEIEFFVRGFTDKSIPPAQMSALAMAIYFQGMDRQETTTLTRAMLESGTVLHWPTLRGTIGDKHSTGGIGDKVSLPLAPLLALAGVRVPMISGRGLGPTGGTLDKLESIQGFRTNLGAAEIQAIVERVGCVICSATHDLAPADRKLYALRDVTGTVPAIPLITASILSKKLAAGLDALVLDVKWGSGAFMKTLRQARELAESLVQVGQSLGLAVSALITDMNQPLGRMAGNGVEVDESLEILSGTGPPDVTHVTLQLGGELLQLLGSVSSRDAGVSKLQPFLQSGAALAKFEEMIAAQGGILQASRPRAAEHLVLADREGYVASIDTELLGQLIINIGGGRRSEGDPIDFRVGFEMLVRLGDRVSKGMPLARLFAHRNEHAQGAQLFRTAIQLAEQPVTPPTVIVAHVTANQMARPGS